jgi:uncharacterized membrane protein YgcG
VSGFYETDLSALDRLEDLLDAYADARLAPGGAVMARIRANVLIEAAAMAATAAAANRLRIVEPLPQRVRWTFPPRFARAVFGLGFAAALMMGTGAAVMAAPPGSPFYNARVYLEALVLPTQLDARLAAHEDLIAERLNEAEAAAAHGDLAALSAALTAYQAEVDAATTDAGTDQGLLAHLEEELARHTAVLTALAATLPEESSIEHAIDASSNAIDKLQQREHPARPTHPPQGGGGSAGGNGGGSDGGGSDGGGGDDAGGGEGGQGGQGGQGGN